MKRRASLLSVTAAAAAVALLSGCSTGGHPGAAAVIGDESISLASVQASVETVRDAQREQPNADELIASSGSLPRQTVDFLVYLEVLEAAAEAEGVEVSRHDVQEARALAEENVGGAEELAQVALMPQSGPPLAGDEQIDLVFRSNLLLQGVAQRIGATNTLEGQQAVSDLLRTTAEDVGVEVNPRYGRWDAEQLTLTEADQPWLRAETPEGAPGEIPAEVQAPPA
ncbi:SurA N-terminal domain-containing protein [Streptomyces avicenniae]|uniref:SurA N-terminal domain-containing protein n=1 Tax=Streptomyces avicenniae TaxID=500153 RepID=UPI00069C4F14|nr:SurA N-terminal domain-containing protein [Streptomyces avicenniae]